MGLPPVRYADDFVVPCANRYDAFAAGAATERLLRDRGLRLQSAKTFIQTPLNSFTFLGVVVPPARRQTATGGLR